VDTASRRAFGLARASAAVWNQPGVSERQQLMASPLVTLWKFGVRGSSAGTLAAERVAGEHWQLSERPPPGLEESWNVSALAANLKVMGPATPSDAVVIRRSLRQPEEFEVLFERHAAIVLRYLQLRVGYGLAEELMAETFVRAFDSRRRFDLRRTSALPWLYGIASNLIRMHFRTEERRLRAYRAAVGLDIQPSDLTEESVERLYASDLAPRLAAALAALPTAQTDVLLLHTYADLTHEEIAEALGISTGSVRKRLHRARRFMEERLDLTGNKRDETFPNARTSGALTGP
jgi:RNA polymerase sigma factor (sigma-70 family)